MIDYDYFAYVTKPEKSWKNKEDQREFTSENGTDLDTTTSNIKENQEHYVGKDKVIRMRHLHFVYSNCSGKKNGTECESLLLRKGNFI